PRLGRLVHAVILVGEYLLRGEDPLAASAYVTTGAGCSFLLAAVLVGGRGLVGATPSALAAFLAGMARIGSAWASIASSFEPVFTFALAWPCSAIRSVRAIWSPAWPWSPGRCCCPCSAAAGRR
ncbi:MAG TPA: hypothetical protein VFC13_27000, partial [Actinomycetes bacterium]|nr:hypothetical protein [Actinomycetes bacterium]